MNEVTFNSADRPIPIKERRNFKECITKLFKIEKRSFQRISYIFCSDNYLLKLNNQYLNHNYYTDILTFLLSVTNKPIESEIYISIDRVKENAKTYNISYQGELLRVMIHGALHLCGYNDDNKSAKNKMQQKENFYIQLYADSRETS